LLKQGDLLLCGANGISASNEAAGQLFLARECNQRLSELGRVAGLLTVLCLPGQLAVVIAEAGTLEEFYELFDEAREDEEDEEEFGNN
jgi:hypothetical protein